MVEGYDAAQGLGDTGYNALNTVFAPQIQTILMRV
jgi:hypothetical protein